MIKKFALILVLAAAVSMGACGKKDDNTAKPGTPPVAGPNGDNVNPGGGRAVQVAGACTINNGGFTVCTQVGAVTAVPDDRLNQAVEQFRKACTQEAGSKFVERQGCSTANALAGCRSKVEDNSQQIMIIYKSALEIPVDSLKTQCQQSGGEFFQP